MFISGIVSTAGAQQRHIQTVPPTYSFQSHLAYLNERMRKRRCFADKQLDTAMFPKESFALGIHGRFGRDVPKYSHRIGATEREYQMHLLKKIFPSMNENVLELVWRAHGCSLEKTIEHLVQTMSLGRNISNGHPKVMHAPSAHGDSLLGEEKPKKTDVSCKTSKAISGMSYDLEPGEREKRDATQSSQRIFKCGPQTLPNNNNSITMTQDKSKVDTKSKDTTYRSIETLSNDHSEIMERDTESLQKTKKETVTGNKKPLAFSIDVLLS